MVAILSNPLTLSTAAMEDVEAVSGFLLKWGSWLFKAVFCCNHSQAQPAEGKFFCHGCGRGIIARWLLLRCTGCGCKRNSRYLFRQVVPQEACCLHCGETEVQREYLEKPSYFHLHHALLVLEEEETYLQGQGRQPQVWVWLDQRPLLERCIRPGSSSAAGEPMPAM